MDTLLNDVRYGLRILRKSPGFTVLAVITLALGIGANTAIFSVVYAIMFRRLPYAQPDRLVKVTLGWKHGGIADNVTTVLAGAVLENNHVFQSAALEFPSTGCNLVGGGTPEYVAAKRVSAGFFVTLGVAPALGREFLEQEAVGGHSAVLSYGLWQSRFGADRRILGRQIACNGETFTVVGVLPRNFRYARRADVWLPDRLANHLQDANGLNYDLIARLRPGVSLAQAQEDGRRMWAQVVREHGSAWYVRNTNGFQFIPYQQWLARDVRRPLLFLLGAVALVLLIAVANVAGLMLARTTARAREIAVRAALGATRARIVGQLLIEALLLSLLGGAAGVLLAAYLNGGLKAIFPADVALHTPVQLDLSGLALHFPVLAYTVVVSCVVGILAGTVPAVRFLRAQPNLALKSKRSLGGNHAQRRGRNLVLVCEVALTMVLLVGCSLLLRSFLLLRSADLGFTPHNLQVAQLSLASQKYNTTAAITHFQQKVLERVRKLPGVVDSASVSSAPLQFGLNLPMPELPGKDCADFPLEYRAVSPSYFSTMGVLLLRGRVFTENDGAGAAPVMIVNRAMARLCWPGADALGAQVWIGKGLQKEGLTDLPRQVVGIIGDMKEYSLDQATPPMAFVPQAQVPDPIDALLYQSFGLLSAMVIRTRSPVDLSLPLARAVQDVDPQQAVASVAPMSQLVNDSVAFTRVLAILMSAFAGLALLLSAVGLYALLSYYVSQRTQEIGIRMALGASQERVLHMVIGEGIVLVGIGTGVGIAAALALTRLAASLLFGITATDTSSFVAAVLCLLGVAFLASYVPARRATRVDPMVALRYE
jgi:putative ABC transport system permease protein